MISKKEIIDAEIVDPISRTKRIIHNPVTDTDYEIKDVSSKAGTGGEIKGMWDSNPQSTHTITGIKRGNISKCDMILEEMEFIEREFVEKLREMSKKNLKGIRNE